MKTKRRPIKNSGKPLTEVLVTVKKEPEEVLESAQKRQVSPEDLSENGEPLAKVAKVVEEAIVHSKEASSGSSAPEATTIPVEQIEQSGDPSTEVLATVKKELEEFIETAQKRQIPSEDLSENEEPLAKRTKVIEQEASAGSSAPEVTTNMIEEEVSVVENENVELMVVDDDEGEVRPNNPDPVDKEDGVQLPTSDDDNYSPEAKRSKTTTEETPEGTSADQGLSKIFDWMKTEDISKEKLIKNQEMMINHIKSLEKTLKDNEFKKRVENAGRDDRGKQISRLYRQIKTLEAEKMESQEREAKLWSEIDFWKKQVENANMRIEEAQVNRNQQLAFNQNFQLREFLQEQIQFRDFQEQIQIQERRIQIQPQPQESQRSRRRRIANQYKHHRGNNNARDRAGNRSGDFRQIIWENERNNRI